jgi:hypothetical protein
MPMSTVSANGYCGVPEAEYERCARCSIGGRSSRGGHAPAEILAVSVVMYGDEATRLLV